MRLRNSKPASDEAIRALEAKMGHILPTGYRDWLVLHDGGRPIPRYFQVSKHPESPFGVVEFLSIESVTESSRLEWNYATYRGTLGKSLLPIAYTDTNDLVCLQLEGNTKGEVVFHDDKDHSTWEVCSSFQEFIASLHELKSR